MRESWRKVQTVYLGLTFVHTLAASLIWGINTLFLLDAGLSNGQAFAANAFFTAGLVLFEIPTGVLADKRGRRLSYLVGTITLAISTLVYLWMWRIKAPFWAWAVTSMFIGLGFTFFSGAVEAWLVDALKASDFHGKLESVFARGQIVEGSAMLTGAVAGGLIAQWTSVGVPYIFRAIALAFSFTAAFIWMRDTGFTPRKTSVIRVLKDSVHQGLGNPPVRWIMIASFFTDGVSIFAFYAMQPYLLRLYGNPKAYWIAGLAAAIVGGAQIGGGLLASRISRWIPQRTTVLLAATLVSASMLLLTGVVSHFWAVLVLLVIWGSTFATVMPVRQAFINDRIPSDQRATVLSFQSLMGSAGGVASQPILGRAADVWGYPVSYMCSAGIQALAIPFVWLARRNRRR